MDTNLNKALIRGFWYDISKPIIVRFWSEYWNTILIVNIFVVWVYEVIIGLYLIPVRICTGTKDQNIWYGFFSDYKTNSEFIGVTIYSIQIVIRWNMSIPWVRLHTDTKQHTINYYIGIDKSYFKNHRQIVYWLISDLIQYCKKQKIKSAFCWRNKDFVSTDWK